MDVKIKIWKQMIILPVTILLLTGIGFGRPDPGQNHSGTDQGVNVDITNINTDNFPGIHIFVRALDDSGNFIPDLGIVNFEVREDGQLVPFDIEASFGYMAVTLVMDQSGSMSGYEGEVIDACSYFVNGFEELDKGAIVKFASTAYVDVPMTYDKQVLLNSIAGYVTLGNTDLYDAIYLGIQECYYEPEKKAVVAFTDGNDNQPGVYAAQLPGFAGTDITIYCIGIGNINADSLIYISQQTGGFYLAITDPSQMGMVLEDIRADFLNLYDIFYTSPQPQANGRARYLEVVCEYGGESGWDTASYIAPLTIPPVVTLSPTTAAMLGVAHTPNTTIYAGCEVEAQNPLTSQRIYYRTVGQPYYQQANLLSGGGNSYYYNIPASYVVSPGVEFYFQVTDDQGSTVTLPGYIPGFLPLSIPVLPNYAPSIEYNPPEIWLTRRSLPVEVVASDYTQSLTGLSLYYRVPGAFFYYEQPLEPAGNNIYTCTLEGPLINEEDDLEMFIAGWDNQGVVNYWYSSYEPYQLEIAVELPPTPPAVALEPASLPIIIPANGGSFNYTMFVINPIPDSGACDVWADIQYPNGLVGNPVMAIYGIELGGGETFIGNYIQEVPDTAQPGLYNFRVHTGEYGHPIPYFTASFPFTKLADLVGWQNFKRGWWNYPLWEEPLPLRSGGQVNGNQNEPLLSAHPNPCNRSTSIWYYLPEAGYAQIGIYNVKGELVEILVDGYILAGMREAIWDAGNSASGIYLCRLNCGKIGKAAKILLIK